MLVSRCRRPRWSAGQAREDPSPRARARLLRRQSRSCLTVVCAGVGGKKGSVEKCPLCKGRGMQIHIQQIGPGMVQQIQTVCIECKGQGERINPKDRCESCSGARVTREKKIIEVHVERGEAGWAPPPEGDRG